MALTTAELLLTAVAVETVTMQVVEVDPTDLTEQPGTDREICVHLVRELQHGLWTLM
ncbi:hypothetical protein D3C86_1342960 [compost metagenome]